MALSDKVLGFFLVVSAIVIFSYYTTWVLVLPFVDSRSPIVSYFPDRELAILVPSITVVILLTVVGVFIGSVMLKEAKKAKKK